MQFKRVQCFAKLLETRFRFFCKNN